MRVGTFIEWEDQSQIPSLKINEVRDAPVLCAISSTDKGPEDWTLLQGKEWFSTYGKNISFAAHGQPLLQTAMAVNSGAKILFKRLVADDAKLANIAVVAKINTESTQKNDEDGNPLYDDGTGNETTNAQKVDAAGQPLYMTEDGSETTSAQKTNAAGQLIYADRAGNETTESQRKDANGLLLYLDDNDVETTLKQKIDGDGNLLYLDGNGNITTEYHAQDSDENFLYKDASGEITTEAQKVNNFGRPVYVKANGDETIYRNSTDEWDATHTEGDGTTAPDPEIKYAAVMNDPVLNQAAENRPSLNTPVMNIAIANDPIMETGASKITYTLRSAAAVSTMEEAVDNIKADLTEDEYLLWVVCDNGRGKSRKRFKMMPDYRMSKNLKYVLYSFMIIEDGEMTESIWFTPNPNQIRNNENISLANMVNRNSKQVKAYEDEEGLTNFLNRVAEIAGITEDDEATYDYLFCRNLKNRPIANIGVDIENGIDLQSNFGQSLQSGDNGSFGDKPWNNARNLYNDQAVRALNGTYDKIIFDVDRYFIDAFIDANYDPVIKRAIEALAIYREDFMYFRDMGLDMWTLEDVIYGDMDNTTTMFAATYCTAYDVIDPYTRKQISVTIMYDIAQLLPPHLNNGYNLPPAGILHNFVLDNAIEGTVHFLPTVSPEIDEKDELNDARVNYASYTENKLVIDTLYTSQEAYTQFSFVNNVMGIQKVVKAIRRRCPIIRYSFIDGDSLEDYKKDIQTVLDRFSSQFKVLEMEYVQDPVYTLNKIFYAVIRVCFRDFVQTELFKIVAFNETTSLS